MYSDRHVDLIDIGTQISVRRLRDNVDAWLYSVYKKFYLHGLTGSALRPRAHSESGAVPLTARAARPWSGRGGR